MKKHIAVAAALILGFSAGAAAKVTYDQGIQADICRAPAGALQISGYSS